MTGAAMPADSGLMRPRFVVTVGTDHHPFDRLIIAQAYLEGMVLGTQDRRMRPYGVMTLGLN